MVAAYRELGLLIVTCLLLSGLAVGAPHHPLSDIYPMDVPFDLEGQPIEDSTGTIAVEDTLNMSGNEIVDFVSESRSSAPLGAQAGQLWFDTGQGVLKYYNGTRWVITASADSVSSDLQSALGAGNQAGSYDINMSGQRVFNIGNGGTSFTTEGNLNLGDQNLTGSWGRFTASTQGWISVGTGDNDDPGLFINDQSDDKTGSLQLAGDGAIVIRDHKGNNSIRFMNDGSLETDNFGPLDMNDNPITRINWSASDTGPGSNLDADSLDGLDRDEFARDTRTFRVDAGSSRRYYKIGEITSGQNGAFRAYIPASTRAASSQPRSVTLTGKFIRDSHTYQHRISGTTSYSDTLDFLVTEDTSTDYDSHYLYIRADQYTGSPVIIEYGNWGNFDFKEVSESDIIGTVIHDTGNSGDSPNMHQTTGSLRAETGNISLGGDYLTDIGQHDLHIGPWDSGYEDMEGIQVSGGEFDPGSRRYYGLAGGEMGVNGTPFFPWGHSGDSDWAMFWSPRTPNNNAEDFRLYIEDDADGSERFSIWGGSCDETIGNGSNCHNVSASGELFRFGSDGKMDFRHGPLDMNSHDINDVGTLNANTKNFVQPINKTHEAVYTAQESQEARAVIEDSTTFNTQETTVELPRHFTDVTVSSKDDINVQTTPVGDALAPVGVSGYSDEHITIQQMTEDPKNLTVHYRVSAVRDGYSNKEIIRKR